MAGTGKEGDLLADVSNSVLAVDTAEPVAARVFGKVRNTLLAPEEVILAFPDSGTDALFQIKSAANKMTSKKIMKISTPKRMRPVCISRVGLATLSVFFMSFWRFTRAPQLSKVRPYYNFDRHKPSLKSLVYINQCG